MATCFLLWCVPVQAHLLNMSRVSVTLDTDRSVAIVMELDLDDALGGSQRYLEVSRLSDPAGAPDMVQLMRRLEQATHITLAGQLVPVRVTGITMPDVPDEDFLNPMIWPRATIRLVGDTEVLEVGATDSLLLQGQFQTTFPFEEPVALTFSDTERDRNMTRWLAVSQKSPQFEGGAWWLAGNSSGNPVQQATPVTQSDIHWEEVRTYLWFGVTHILPGGVDHLLFVLGLFLGAASLRSLITLITVFTVAHSATLIISTLGIWRLPAGVVEPLITASIAWIALENLLPQQHLLRKALLVFGFGLLHGMGFAGTLAEIGLPEAAFLASMFSFNVGVEFGQITFVAGLLLITAWCRQADWYRQRIVIPMSIVTGIVAVLWTGQRLSDLTSWGLG